MKRTRDHTHYNEGTYTACMNYRSVKRKRVQHHVTEHCWDSLSIIISLLQYCMHFTTEMPFYE